MEAIRYAVAVAEVGSFTSAARRFGITQPTLSISIAKFEEHLGVPLFERTPRGVIPTDFGNVLIPRLHRIVGDLAWTETEADSLISRGRGTVRVGTSPQIEKALVAELCAAIARPDGARSAREVTLLETDLDQLQDYVRNGELDVVVIPSLGLLPEYSHHLVNSDYLVLVDPENSRELCAAEGIPFRRVVEPVSIRDLADRDLILSRNGCGITLSVERLLGEIAREARHARVEVRNSSMFAGWVDEGMGSVILPERQVPDGMAVRRIRREDGTFAEIFNEMIWDPNSPDAAYVAHLAGSLSDQLADERAALAPGA